MTQPALPAPDQPPQDDILPDDTFLRAADDPFAPGDMPLALLEFHSPTAALVNLPPTPAARHIVWIVGGLMACSLLGMTVFPLSRVVSTQGRLVSSQATLLVQPLDTAIIRAITVTAGDVVHKGDVLARLDPTQAGADSANLGAQRAQYQAETNRLKAEATGAQYHPDPNDPASLTEAEAFLRRKAEYDASVGKYANQIASLQSDLLGYQASAALYAARARVMSDVLGMRQQLQKEQVGSRLSTLAARNDLMEVERAQVAARQQADSTRSRLAAQTAERDSYEQNWKAEVYRDLVTAEHRLSEAQAAYSKAVLHDTMVLLRADEDAVVLNLGKVSVGSVVTPAQPVMTLVPTGQGLEIEAVMSGHDVGFVRLGDHALVKFATFPYQQYGGAEATVRTISADAFTPDGTGGAGPGNELTPENAAQAFYRVRLRIDRYTLHGVPGFFHPLPGMVVSADIHVGKRTIMQYLLNAIVPLATTGMREP
ncbi:HlyD family type I secretion periplasmic adaptor subunit [Acetobacter sp. TBRC 12305]|uniref:Membrane fusion protein (MFP) family protein n=1 Tax=Acetobacter garciniae TaxID=2817435 RepID=A0A939HN57_9PROT|nr:HlyD family type I secretion periplasmic adaptor subunit [Acetobacter garciniae]MBO1326085.1 HlyD family type I secretion periplasmic adaptor subunit [Acetobacter garciniae]MBX0345170.1 HlyD family type I secretion periplasmic adaptor subunit [Acetobacter garciniae]